MSATLCEVEGPSPRSWLARLKAWAARHMLVLEFCHDCGRHVVQIWTAADPLWARFTEPRQYPLCIGCFDRRAQREGVLLRWVPQVIAREAQAQ